MTYGHRLMTESTRDRLLTAGMALFAQHGLRGTAVGDIEEAAGLTRRGGAFYKHFRSKEQLLETGVDRAIDHVTDVGALLRVLPPSDLRAELNLLARGVLAELSRQHDVIRVIQREGDRMPELRDRTRDSLVETAFASGVALAERWLPADAGARIDVAGGVVVVLGGLVNYRMTEWLFGSPPLGMDEDAFVTTWVELCIRLFREAGTIEGGP
jgi:AcrR family transcriptional regulator